MSNSQLKLIILIQNRKLSTSQLGIPKTQPVEVSYMQSLESHHLALSSLICPEDSCMSPSKCPASLWKPFGAPKLTSLGHCPIIPLPVKSTWGTASRVWYTDHHCLAHDYPDFPRKMQSAKPRAIKQVQRSYPVITNPEHLNKTEAQGS